MRRIALTAITAAVVVTTAYVGAMVPEQVRIDSGMLAGTSSGQPTVRVFKGIPFAAPPLGENRWKAPQPVAKWDGVRKADAFGAPCAAGAPAAGRGGGGARGGSARCSSTGGACRTAARTGSQRGLSVSQRLDEREQPERSPPGDGVDLRRWLHGRLRRPGLV